MALAEEQKCKALYHLCYPVNSIVIDSVNYHSIIADRLEGLPDFAIDKVEAVLLKLDQTEEKIEKANDCLKVKSVDNITFNMDHIENMRREYRRLQKKLSCIIDIPINRSGGMVIL